MAESFFNAWIVEMKCPKHRLYCTWHVDRAWRKKLVKMKSKDKQCEICKLLRTLLHEQDPKAFEIFFKESINQLSANDETVDFANYFSNNYGTCVESWAYCHRLHAGINTNMHIERMYQTLKHIYLEGKKVKRLDKSIHVLLKFLRDKSIHRLFVLHKGKLTSKIKELRKKHKNSLEISTNNVLKNEEDCWNVMASGHDDMYTVNKLKNSCDCQNVCDECKTFCQSEISKNINTNSYTKKLSLEENNKKNETVSIVFQLNNRKVIHEVDNLEHEKQKFKNIFDIMLHTVTSLEELDLIIEDQSNLKLYKTPDLNNAENDDELIIDDHPKSISDPALWKINKSSIDYFILNQPKQNVETINFNATRRSISKYIRHLPRDIFKRTMQNGETAFRDWILYSNSKKLETLKFLTSRGLAIRGSNETLGSVHNGNYLGCLELIAKFDPFISQHLIKYENKGHGNVSYISSTICTEFIMVMGEAVIKEIVNQIQSRKYFSIIVDSTTDITKIDQLIIAIRYVMSDGFPIVRFIGFLPSVGHKGEDMEKAVINTFSELNINIENCRGQAYDNASNMSAHSLNLVGSNAAESTSFGTQFFCTSQMIYNFFSVSTYRWDLLCRYLNHKGNDNQTVNIKKLSTTRWSSRYDVCKALYLGYNQIKNTLEDIIKDHIQKQETRNEASSILNKLDSLDFAFMICLWTPILKCFNATSVTLQSTNIDLSTVTKLYESLESYIKNIRNNFDYYLLEAQKMSGKTHFKSTSSRRKKRVVFFDETLTDEVSFQGADKMKNVIFNIKSKFWILS
ncbi:hypothetical protein QTP88_027277 [Uroleucon formosanum]